MDGRHHSDSSEKAGTRVFISHSSQDTELVKAFNNLIDSTLRVPPGTVRCTSDPRYSLDPGENHRQKLRSDIEGAIVVIGLLTPSSLNSSYVLMELGAAWGFKRHVIPIVAGGLSSKDIPGPIGGDIHAVRADDPIALAEVLKTVSRKCDMPVRITVGGLLEAVNQFAESAKSYRSKRHHPGDLIQDLGNFPVFLPTITEAIEKENSEIHIACDYVGYGMYSAGTEFDKYRLALLAAKSRGCTIRILALGSKPWQQMSVQVPTEHEEDFQKLMRREVFKKSLEGFGERVRQLDLPGLPPRTWTREEQLKALVQVEDYYDRTLRGAGIQITNVSGPLPLYLWITKSAAIWVLCPLEPRIRFPLIWYDVLTEGEINPDNPLDEHGFLSCDKRLVQRFRLLWEQYLDVASRTSSAASAS